MERPDALESYDYSTPEARKALEDVTRLVLEIREEASGTLRRKVRLYERTLGLAVVPVLLRRAVIVVVRKLRGERPSR